MAASEADLRDWSRKVLNGRSFSCDIAALAGLADDEAVVRAGPEGTGRENQTQSVVLIVLFLD